MYYRKTSIWRSIDWITVFLYLLLVLGGWFSIYGASYDFDQTSILDWESRSGKQMIWILTSIGLAFIIMLIDKDWYEVFAYWIYALIIILLIVTYILAPDIKGSRSWLVITSSVNIQPAEFAKFAPALALAKFMGGYKFELMKPRNFAVVLGLILLPMALILIQKETGTALVYLAFFLVLYREGMPGTILFTGFCMVLFFVISLKFTDSVIFNSGMGEFLVLCIIILIIFWLISKYKKNNMVLKHVLIGSASVIAIAALVAYFYPYNFIPVLIAVIAGICLYLLFLSFKFRYPQYLIIVLFAFFSVSFLYSVDYVFDQILEPHQQTRIQILLGTKDDPSGAGYNVNQSKIAIGSGGLSGKGFLNGTQTKLKYVPEQDTDFIFCTIGEEQGFWGTSLVLLMYTILILRLIYLSEKQKTAFNRIYGYSVASILFFHLAINIGMVIGLTPVIGIPLPFFSYGGSSLWGFTILLFIFLRLDAAKADRY